METNERKKIILSGMQPSGALTIGNYLGALKNWAALMDDYDALYMVADMHSITVRQDPTVLRRRILETYALFLASGIDPVRSAVFVQSQVPEHAVLSWILNCNTYLGELSRMTQYKDKSAKHADNLNAGLFTYPVLMASDILLYQADLVPVGADQKQHVEITRDIATRFNNAYGQTFTVPEPYIPKVGAKIMSLAEPEKKMSKSDANPNATILITDTADVITRKIKRAVTDCCTGVPCLEDCCPGVVNLMSIYAAFTSKTPIEAQSEFTGKSYGVLKQAAADATVAALSPLQAEYSRLMADKAYLAECMREGAKQASLRASRTLRKVYHKVGFDCIK